MLHLGGGAHIEHRACACCSSCLGDVGFTSFAESCISSRTELCSVQATPCSQTLQQQCRLALDRLHHACLYSALLCMLCLLCLRQGSMLAAITIGLVI